MAEKSKKRYTKEFKQEAVNLVEKQGYSNTAVNPNIRTTHLSGICIPKLVLKENANERKKKITFGKV